MTSPLSQTAPLRSWLPLSWLLLAAAPFGCGGGGPIPESPPPDTSGLQNLFDVPVPGMGSDGVAKFNDGDRLFEIRDAAGGRRRGRGRALRRSHPLRVIDANGAPAWILASQFQTEIEYALTDRLELGLYLTLAPTDPSVMFAPNMPAGTGVKQRLRYRFADAGCWPIDLAVHGEVSENQREMELEAKVILQRRLGPFRIAANAWAEREFYFSGAREWVLNPTAGIMLEKSITAQPGIEYWMHGEHADGGGWVIGPEH